MTSLVLFKSDQLTKGARAKSAIDWGTGKVRSPANKSRPPSVSGTFLHVGEPISQQYRNTDLTLSDARLNDELVPAPLHTTDVLAHEIPCEFPSNHPFTSHISENAVFPIGGVDSNDRPSTHVDPYVVTHKIRGNPFRREVHYTGSQRERCQTAAWPDRSHLKLPRSLSNIESSSLYPWPRKMLAPNGKNSTTNFAAGIAKHREKCPLKNTNQNNTTNEERLVSHPVNETTTKTILSNEQLNPYTDTAFESIRSTKAMQTNHFHENHQPANMTEKETTPVYYAPMETTKVMSENEHLDHQLSYGTDYVNLPTHRYSNDLAPTWILRQQVPSDSQVKPPEIRYLNSNRPSTTTGQLARDRYASHQQMDAENRLQQLEVIRPSDNINLLNVKFRNLQHPRHARPTLPQYRDDYVNTLYDQTGTYVQERSGLYHTNNYDPNELVKAIPELENHTGCHATESMDNSLGDLLNTMEQNQNRARPALFQNRALGDYQNMRSHLVGKFRVPNNAADVESRTQEGDKSFVQRESVYGQAYNTHKFLQENVLLYHARMDPTRLMSTRYNNNLERVRSINSHPIKATHCQSINKSQAQTNEALVSPVLRPSENEEVYKTKYAAEHTNGYSRRPTVRVYDSPFKTDNGTKFVKPSDQLLGRSQSLSVEPISVVPPQLQRSFKSSLRLPGPEVVARLTESNNEKPTTYQRSYKDITYHESTPQTPRSTRRDNRFVVRASDNLPRETNLLDLQEQWSKTLAQKQYQSEHPETVPDVGHCTIRAKKQILIADAVEKRAAMIVR